MPSKKSDTPTSTPWILVRKITIVSLAVLSIVLWFSLDGTPELKTFCDELEKGTHYNLVVSTATSRGFSIPFYAREDDKLTIFNKKGMLFDHGCTVHFIASHSTSSTFFER